MKNKNLKNQLAVSMSGFSLMEVIIVVAIIGIMTSVTWVTLSKAKNGTIARNACEEAAAVINKGRAYAISGKCSQAGTTQVSVTFFGDASVAITGGDCSEAFSLPANSFCNKAVFDFRIPGGAGGAGSLVCGSGSVTKTVTVDNYKAVCQ